jgi:hypothetical protein
VAPLFPKWTNSLLYALLASGFAGLVSLLLLPWVLVRTDYFDGRNDQRVQPVKFDHRHHVRDDGLDCRYCHYAVDRSAYAGIPASSLCMNCHNQVWSESPELAPVRASYFEDKPLHWKRVTSQPDHVFFDHSIHLAKGVGCVSCHGRVDEMGQVYQVERMTMGWCLDCHRQPEKHLRPREEITNMSYVPDVPQEVLGARLKRELSVEPTTDCSGCHR